MPVIYYRNPNTGEWVEIGGSGPPGQDGPDEVWVGPSQPIEPADFDLWIDTDGEAAEASFFPLGDLTDVTAPIDTPVGKVLGTTATGQWGPIDPPEGGLSQADTDARYVNIDGDVMTGELTLFGRNKTEGTTETSMDHYFSGIRRWKDSVKPDEWAIGRYDESGAYIESALSITNATGVVNVKKLTIQQKPAAVVVVSNTEPATPSVGTIWVPEG